MKNLILCLLMMFVAVSCVDVEPSPVLAESAQESTVAAPPEEEGFRIICGPDDFCCSHFDDGTYCCVHCPEYGACHMTCGSL